MTEASISCGSLLIEGKDQRRSFPSSGHALVLIGSLGDKHIFASLRLHSRSLAPLYMHSSTNVCNWGRQVHNNKNHCMAPPRFESHSTNPSRIKWGRVTLTMMLGGRFMFCQLKKIRLTSSLTVMLKRRA